MNKNIKIEKISISTPSRQDYNITVGKSILDTIGNFIELDYDGSKVTVITDETVYGLYYERLEKSLKSKYEIVNCIKVKAGESSKSVETLDFVTNELALLNHRRSDLIIAFGGGVIGDLAGFVSSVYLRGVPFVQIPTTLLSQVDSSVGGKVAINIDAGKNLMGSFYNPLAVYIDVETLKTLEKSQLKDGLGEVIKYAFIEDKEIIDILLKYDIETLLDSDLKEVIIRCIKSKKHFVEVDFYDKKERMILNFGHTLAHAIEKQYGYGVVTHGQAVAAGMYMISELLYENGLIRNPVHTKVKELLKRYEMNNVYNLEIDQTFKATLNDKKTYGQLINIIAVDEIGEGEILKIEIDKFKDMIHSYLK